MKKKNIWGLLLQRFAGRLHGCSLWTPPVLSASHLIRARARQPDNTRPSYTFLLPNASFTPSTISYLGLHMSLVLYVSFIQKWRLPSKLVFFVAASLLGELTPGGRRTTVTCVSRTALVRFSDMSNQFESDKRRNDRTSLPCCLTLDNYEGSPDHGPPFLHHGGDDWRITTSTTTRAVSRSNRICYRSGLEVD